MLNLKETNETNMSMHDTVTPLILALKQAEQQSLVQNASRQGLVYSLPIQMDILHGK